MCITTISRHLISVMTSKMFVQDLIYISLCLKSCARFELLFLVRFLIQPFLYITHKMLIHFFLLSKLYRKQSKMTNSSGYDDKNILYGGPEPELIDSTSKSLGEVILKKLKENENDFMFVSIC